MVPILQRFVKNMEKKKDTEATGDRLPVNQDLPPQPLLDKHAAKYLRESGSIEELPDPEQEKEAEQKTEKTSSKK